MFSDWSDDELTSHVISLWSELLHIQWIVRSCPEINFGTLAEHGFMMADMTFTCWRLRYTWFWLQVSRPRRPANAAIDQAWTAPLPVPFTSKALLRLCQWQLHHEQNCCVHCERPCDMMWLVEARICFFSFTVIVLCRLDSLSCWFATGCGQSIYRYRYR